MAKKNTHSSNAAETAPVEAPVIAEIVSEPQDVPVSVSDIIEGRPWNEWPELRTTTVTTENLRVVPSQAAEGMLDITVESDEESEDDGDEFRAFATRDIMEILSVNSGFPLDFVNKLPNELKCQVINDRLANGRSSEREMNVITRGDTGAAIGFASPWRELPDMRTLCNSFVDALGDRLGDITIDSSDFNGGIPKVRLMTPRVDPITPKVGDTLQYGMSLGYSTSYEFEVSVYARRLLCANGMAGNRQLYSWRRRESGSAESQMAWMIENVGRLVDTLDTTTAKARQMAETIIHGDIYEALESRVRSMGLGRYLVGIRAAFDEEPGNTEWAIMNAVTRFSTHSRAVRDSERPLIDRAAGNWTDNYELVTTRVPRVIANRRHYEIVDTSSPAPEGITVG